MLQQLDHGQAHAFVVLDHQDGFLAAAVSRLLGVDLTTFGFQAVGEIHLHYRAFALLAPHLHMPAALAHKPEHHAQAQAGAVPFALGGEERLERTLEHLLGHADTGVGHCQTHVFTGLDAFTDAIARVEDDIFAADANHAFALHGIAGIDRQVEQRVFQLVTVDIDAPGVLGQLHVDMNGLTQRPLQQLAQACVDALRVVHRR